MSRAYPVRVAEGAAAPSAAARRHPRRHLPAVATPSAPDAKVYFVYPQRMATSYPSNGDPFRSDRDGDVAPAGIEKANTGHHHLIIDAPLPPFGEPIPHGLQSSAFRSRTNRSANHASAWPAYTAIAARRREPRASRSAGLLQADHGRGTQRSGRNPGAVRLPSRPSKVQESSTWVNYD